MVDKSIVGVEREETDEEEEETNEEEERGMRKKEEDRERWGYAKKRPPPKPFPPLPWPELMFYFVSFWAGCLYSLLRFYRTSQRWGQYLHVTQVPAKGLWWGGWWFGGVEQVRQDQTDWEWYVWVPILLSYAPLGLLHVLLAQAVRRFCPQYLCGFYIGFSLCIMLALIGRVGTVLCLSVPAIMFVVLLTRLKLLVWLTWCLILILINTQYFNTTLVAWVEDAPEWEYKISVMVAWIILRSLSFSLEVCDADPDGSAPHASLLITLLGYCLYLPFLCTGPYMPYTDFRAGLSEPYRGWTIRKLGWTVLQVLRFLLWMGLANFLLFHFYAHSLHYMPELVKRMNSWSMAGFVYFLAAFMLLKYVVLYGLPSVLARLEGYEPPSHPRCTLMTYRMSDVWREFDHGLYRFMLKHIYIPWVGTDTSLYRQLQGTALVFTFVYVWHGVSAPIFWWSAINFFGVVVEKAGDSIARTPHFKAWEVRWLPGAWQRRFHGLLAVGLYVPSLASLTIFLSSLENAQTVTDRIFFSGFPQCTATMFFFMFCLGQCSMELQNWKMQLKQNTRPKLS